MGDVICIQTQFDDMDVDFSDLTIKYNHTMDALDLDSANMGTVYLEPKEACKSMTFGHEEDLEAGAFPERLRRRLLQGAQGLSDSDSESAADAVQKRAAVAAAAAAADV